MQLAKDSISFSQAQEAREHARRGLSANYNQEVGLLPRISSTCSLLPLRNSHNGLVKVLLLTRLLVFLKFCLFLKMHL
jgi:hypothetical protein